MVESPPSLPLPSLMPHRQLLPNPPWLHFEAISKERAWGVDMCTFILYLLLPRHAQNAWICSKAGLRMGGAGKLKLKLPRCRQRQQAAYYRSYSHTIQGDTLPTSYQRLRALGRMTPQLDSRARTAPRQQQKTHRCPRSRGCSLSAVRTPPRCYVLPMRCTPRLSYQYVTPNPSTHPPPGAPYTFRHLTIGLLTTTSVTTIGPLGARNQGYLTSSEPLFKSPSAQETPAAPSLPTADHTRHVLPGRSIPNAFIGSRHGAR
jgi:hypothetical protein